MFLDKTISFQSKGRRGQSFSIPHSSFSQFLFFYFFFSFFLWIYNDYSFFFTSIRCFSSCISFSSPISLEFPLRVSVSFFISILSPYLSDLLLGVFRGASDSDGNVRRKSGIKRLMVGLHLAYSSFRSQAGWLHIHLFRARVAGRLHRFVHESLLPGLYPWQHPEYGHFTVK